MRLLGRLLLFVLGLSLAIPTGAVLLTLGALFEPTARGLATTIASAGLFNLLQALAEGLENADPQALRLSGVLGSLLAGLLVLPPAFAAATGEIVGLRALAWNGGAPGLFTALVPWLARARVGGASGAALVAEGRITAMLFLVGAGAGFVYWLVAGRTAGRRASDPIGPRPPGS